MAFMTHIASALKKVKGLPESKERVGNFEVQKNGKTYCFFYINGKKLYQYGQYQADTERYTSFPSPIGTNLNWVEIRHKTKTAINSIFS